MKRIAENADDIEFSIVLPCLNEAQTLGICITKASNSLTTNNVKGEVIVADNGSTDDSIKIAQSMGARVVKVSSPGYGNALLGGFKASRGKYIIMADADDSYALDELTPFIIELRNGADLVMGNRFKGGIKPGAMPWLHKYLGIPVLSFLGRKFYKAKIGDFHCGLRGFNRIAILNLNLAGSGMEFASEMVVKATISDLKVVEVPTVLKPDGRSRKPHLRTWRDGWRHLVFLLVGSPKWLFLYPGITMSVVGAFGMILLSDGNLKFQGVSFDLNTFFFAEALLVAGTETIFIAFIAQIFGENYGILKKRDKYHFLYTKFTLELELIFGFVFSIASIAVFLWRIATTSAYGPEGMNYEHSLRITGLVTLLGIIGVQLLFSSFMATSIQSNI